ncbi:hypothetical protein GCM10027288_58000 [Bordetella tumbae]|uniref:transcriptional regulator n=1 Tax=Bordetella tumbae TaxID=1649139 RepID=UPI0039EF84F3
MKPPIEHPLDRAARVIGSAAALARLLGVTRGAVTQYKEQGRRIPAEHCPIIERETKARGEAVTCEALRPDVDWSVLRQAVPELAQQREVA